MLQYYTGTLELLPPARRLESRSAHGSSGLRNNSAVINFEVAVLESAKITEKTGVSATHTGKCFEMLDEIIPLLGTHSRVIKLLRDELYDAVYSNEYSTGAEDCTSNCTPQRQPYITLIRKYHNQSQEVAKMAQEKTLEYRGKLEDMAEQLHKTSEVKS